MEPTLTLLPGQHWYPAHRADARGLALYQRHYSAAKTARWRLRSSRNFVAAGQPLVLLTTAGDAVWVWLHNTAERLDHQEGVCCTLFRNEGPLLSSLLVREADTLAWSRWPDVPRHFTYVDPGQVRRKRDPGRCFRRAGWRPCGTSQRGLLLLEMYPEWVPQVPQEVTP